MADSSLDPDNMPLPDRQLGKGHGTRALGPSDTSDSGSDMIGPGMSIGDDDGLDLDQTTTSDLESNTSGTAGPDVGDANLDSDTDSSGTGERATAGRDSAIEDGRDIDTDHVERIDPDISEPDDAETGKPKRRA
ncbi:MAG: hypothetical protein H7315_04415 [Herminiimonas sp.]|nr:hypothetical protein [Herminiimonas sp.]